MSAVLEVTDVKTEYEDLAQAAHNLNAVSKRQPDTNLPLYLYTVKGNVYGQVNTLSERLTVFIGTSDGISINVRVPVKHFIGAVESHGPLINDFTISSNKLVFSSSVSSAVIHCEPAEVDVREYTRRLYESNVSSIQLESVLLSAKKIVPKSGDRWNLQQVYFDGNNAYFSDGIQYMRMPFAVGKAFSLPVRTLDILKDINEYFDFVDSLGLVVFRGQNTIYEFTDPPLTFPPVANIFSSVEAATSKNIDVQSPGYVLNVLRSFAFINPQVVTVKFIKDEIELSVEGNGTTASGTLPNKTGVKSATHVFNYKTLFNYFSTLVTQTSAVIKVFDSVPNMHVPPLVIDTGSTRCVMFQQPGLAPTAGAGVK